MLRLMYKEFFRNFMLKTLFTLWLLYYFSCVLLSADFFFKFNFFEKNISGMSNVMQIGPRFGLTEWRA